MTGPAAPLPETSPNWAASARRRLIFYLFAAILLAILAGTLTFVYLDRLRAASLPSNPAVVALVDIPPGAAVDETMVELKLLPDAALPAGALTDVSQAIGRVAAIPISAREVLLPSRFVGGGGEGLSGRLPDGRWAMILPVGWLVSGTPELVEGDRLEIMAYQACRGRRGLRHGRRQPALGQRGQRRFSHRHQSGRRACPTRRNASG